MRSGAPPRHPGTHLPCWRAPNLLIDESRLIISAREEEEGANRADPSRAAFTADCDAFAALVAERYFALTCAAVRAADPHCMSSEHFGQFAWQFERMSGSSGLKVQAAIAC